MLSNLVTYRPQELRASTWTRHKAFYTTLLLLVIVGGIMVVVIPRYTRSNENSDNSDMQGKLSIKVEKKNILRNS